MKDIGYILKQLTKLFPDGLDNFQDVWIFLAVIVLSVGISNITRVNFFYKFSNWFRRNSTGQTDSEGTSTRHLIEKSISDTEFANRSINLAIGDLKKIKDTLNEIRKNLKKIKKRIPRNR